jgi:hypothetical protein
MTAAAAVPPVFLRNSRRVGSVGPDRGSSCMRPPIPFMSLSEAHVPVKKRVVAHSISRS